MSGGKFSVQGGYWQAGCALPDRIFRNGFDAGTAGC
jgi:hypothetical protein